MKVKELIQELQKQNQESEVVFDKDSWLEISQVFEDDNNGKQQSVVVIN